MGRGQLAEPQQALKPLARRTLNARPPWHGALAAHQCSWQPKLEEDQATRQALEAEAMEQC